MDPVKIIPALCILTLMLCAGCTGNGRPGTNAEAGPTATATLQVTPMETTVPGTSVTTSTGVPTSAPTPAPLYPGALKLKSSFTFGNGTTWTTDSSVNRIWINDTFRWFNPRENQYETRVAPEGKKFLFVFISMVNRGTERAPLPQQGNIYVLCNNEIITPDTLHPLPMQNPDSTPSVARIAEIEYTRKIFSSEQVEDYGYSHGQKQSYISPGESNAVEGYIIYVVPATMQPETTYVRIVMPDKSEGTWVLG